MGSLKPSVRSKAVQPTIVSNGNGHHHHHRHSHHHHHHLETDDALSEGLNAFRTDAFDPDSYVQARCQTMSEKVHTTLFSNSDIFSLLFRSLRYAYFLLYELLFEGKELTVSAFYVRTEGQKGSKTYEFCL